MDGGIMAPINEKMMANLKKQYGDQAGEDIYYKMEREGKVPVAGKRKKVYLYGKGKMQG